VIGKAIREVFKNYGLEVMLQRTAVALVLLLLVSLPLPSHCFSQQDETHKIRKVVNEVTPQYPALARTEFAGYGESEALVSREERGKSKEGKCERRPSGAGPSRTQRSA
jgi:hypothetical protein